MNKREQFVYIVFMFHIPRAWDDNEDCFAIFRLLSLLFFDEFEWQLVKDLLVVSWSRANKEEGEGEREKLTGIIIRPKNIDEGGENEEKKKDKWSCLNKQA